MIETVSRYRFCDVFKMIRPHNFSYEGLHALFDYIEEFEADTGQQIEFDPIALCCEYSEYANIQEIQEDYPSYEFKSWDDVENETTVIQVDWEDEGRAIILNF